MSTFGGKLYEIANVSLDQFEDENLNSSVYFLSHCHTDHMRGLQSENFQKHLLGKSNVYLYASQVSITILNNLIPILSPKLKSLPLGSPTLITIYDENSEYKNVNVTPIPAGHCPGSIMFLFETNQRILYTGDFRINPTDIIKYKPFLNSQGKMKHIDTIYLDTTFFKKTYCKFPNRQESITVLCDIIRKWISISSKHVINIATPARYGSEYLFMEIYNGLKQPVHVSSTHYDFYSKVPEMDKAVTLDGTQTQIHSFCNGWRECLCMEFESNVKIHIKEIKPTAMYWNNDNLENGIFQDYANFARVCYSSHPSYSEIKEFVCILKPNRVVPNVVPQNKAEEMIMLQDIENLIKECKKVAVEDQLGQFDIDNKRNNEPVAATAQEIREHSMNRFLDSPPSRKRKPK